MAKLTYNITGLEEFEISWQAYCAAPCQYQRHCRYSKNEPFQIVVDCKDFRNAKDKKKNEAMEKIGRKNPEWDWDKREAAAEKKVRKPQIFSQIWEDKVKKHKDELYCIGGRTLDQMVRSMISEEYWSDFREVIKEIEAACSKIS